MMTIDLIASIAVIETALNRLDRRVLLRSLEPGQPTEVVRDALLSARLEPSRELGSLLSWRDDTATQRDVTLDDIRFFPGFYLLSINDAIANYRAFLTDSRWTRGWLPLFANGGGDFYVLDLSDAQVQPVRHFRIEETDHPVEFSSLTAMMATLAEAFHREIFFVDTTGYLEMDDRTFGDLASEMNPDVVYWRALT